jgi:hypothetical protein
MFVVAGGGAEKRVVIEREMESSITDVLVNCLQCATQVKHSYSKAIVF